MTLGGRLIGMAAALLACAGLVASAAAAPPAPCPDAAVAGDIATLLPRLAGRLATRQPIVIVAIGSSSTAGSGASAPDRSYPAQLQQALAKLWPDQKVVVLNRGINGEDAADMRKRFARDVVAEHPDLVVWQLGTNYLMRNDGVVSFGTTLGEGIDELRVRGLDVVLMDPQYAPKVLADPDAETMVSLIAAIAHDRHAGLFRRFDLMSHWVRDEDLPFTDIIATDGLHMNDWSYGCVAQGLATALNRAAKNSLIGRADIAN
ncbi:MAG: SGNH/GDSL hydrolase family protein [Rhodospirillales bacterium]